MKINTEKGEKEEKKKKIKRCKLRNSGDKLKSRL